MMMIVAKAVMVGWLAMSQRLHVGKAMAERKEGELVVHINFRGINGLHNFNH